MDWKHLILYWVVEIKQEIFIQPSILTVHYASFSSMVAKRTKKGDFFLKINFKMWNKKKEVKKKQEVAQVTGKEVGID